MPHELTSFILSMFYPVIMIANGVVIALTLTFYNPAWIIAYGRYLQKRIDAHNS